MNQFFPHEASKAYELALEWAISADDLINQLPQGAHLRSELDRLSTTVTLDVATAIGKMGSSERVGALEKARSSVVASAAIIDVLGVKNLVEQGEIVIAKRRLSQIYRVLSGMIQSTNTNEFIRARLSVPD